MKNVQFSSSTISSGILETIQREHIYYRLITHPSNRSLPVTLTDL